MKMLKALKDNKGISVVTLVITVIVLIILAGISINIFVGQDGILTTAQRSKDNIELAQAAAQERLNEFQSNYYQNLDETGSGFVDYYNSFEEGYAAGQRESSGGDATADKILKNFSAFVNGTLVSGTMETLGSSDFSKTKSSTEAGAASNYTVKSTAAGYLPSDTTIATLSAETTPTIDTTGETGTQTIDVVPGFYNKVSVDQTTAYNAGYTAGQTSFTGGDATADKILKNYTAYAGGVLVTGSIETLTSKNFAGAHSSTTAGAASNYTITSTADGYVENGTTVATLTATTSDTINATGETGTQTIDVVPGYYNKISVNQTNTYNAGYTAGQTSLTGGTATADKILKDYTAYVNGTLVTGTMDNYSENTQTVTLTAEQTGESTHDIADGYHTDIKVNAAAVYSAGIAVGEANLTGGDATADKILKDYTAYVNGELVTGTMPTLTSTNFTGAHSSTTAGAVSNYTVKSKAAGYVANNTTVATLAAGTSPTIATTGATGEETINIKPGYYNKIKVDRTAAYNAGVASLTGGNATAAQILKDKTAYVNGVLVTGTMETLTSTNFTGAHSSTTAGADSNYTVKSSAAGYVANNTTVATLAATTSDTINTTSATGTKTINIKPGYYNKIKVNQTNAYNAGKASITGGDATEAQILKDKTAYVNGTLVTGTMNTLTSDNFAGTHSSTTAGEDSNYTVTSSADGYVANGTTVATLAATTSDTINTTSATGTKTINIKPGYYNKISVNQTAAYEAGYDAGVASLTGGTATAARILKDYTAYVNGALVTGTMATLTSDNFAGTHSSTTAGAASNYTVKASVAGYVAKDTIVNTLAATTSDTIATTSETGTKTINIKPGYYNKIKVNQTNAYNAGKASITGGNATAAQILKNKTAYVNGTLVTGTMPSHADLAESVVTTYVHPTYGPLVYFETGYWNGTENVGGHICSHIKMTTNQLKDFANSAGVGYTAGYNAGYAAGVAAGQAAGKTVTLRVVTSGSSSRWLSESGQGISGFYINGNSIGTGALHGGSTYEWSTTI